MNKLVVLCAACGCFFLLTAYLSIAEITCLTARGGGSASGGEDICAAMRTALFGWPQLTTVYALQGVGRGVWESTNRAMWADAFPGCADAAFAMLLLQFGLASTLAYLLIPQVPPLAGMSACGLFALLGCAGCVRSHALTKSAQRRVSSVLQGASGVGKPDGSDGSAAGGVDGSGCSGDGDGASDGAGDGASTSHGGDHAAGSEGHTADAYVMYSEEALRGQEDTTPSNLGTALLGQGQQSDVAERSSDAERL